MAGPQALVSLSSTSIWDRDPKLGPACRARKWFVAFSINAEGSDQHQVVADMQPVDLDDQEPA
jgi:hypothetical protein